MSFFARARKFPSVDSAAELNTEEFAKCIEDFLPFLDTLGGAYTPVKANIQAHIERMRKARRKCGEKVKTVEQLFEQEQTSKRLNTAYSGSEAVLWLFRTLLFISEYITLLADDPELDTKTIAGNAYKKSLEKHHGWFLRKVFKAISCQCACRADLMKNAASDEDITEDQIVEEMNEYIETYDSVLIALKDLLERYEMKTISPRRKRRVRSRERQLDAFLPVIEPIEPMHLQAITVGNL